MDDSVYEPSDDSFFLVSFARAFAFGKVLDMGSGSGFIAESVVDLDCVDSVLACDISDASVKLLKSKSISSIRSNLFSNFKKDEFFDTVIFNPPYLPQDEGVVDVALYGGKKGYEVIRNFLFSVSPFLSKDGVVLLLFSSLTNRKKVEEFIVDCGFVFSILGIKKLFMEELFVVKIERSDFLKSVESRCVSSIKKFAKGKRSVVYSGILNKNKVVVKVESKKDVVSNEVKFLKKLNKFDLGPKLLFSSKNFFVCKFVDGLRILEFFEKSSKKKILKVIKQILLQCRVLDSLFIEKCEMSNPYKHILVDSRNKVFFIDFERCREKKFPSNITQFISFLFKKKVVILLERKGIFFNREIFLDFCKAYKKNQSGELFDKFLLEFE